MVFRAGPGIFSSLFVFFSESYQITGATRVRENSVDNEGFTLIFDALG